MKQEIEHIERRKRFQIRLTYGKASFLKYDIKDGKMFIEETYTPPEYRGRGLATKLMEAALKYAEERNLKIVPKCSFAEVYFKKHPEKIDMLATIEHS